MTKNLICLVFMKARKYLRMQDCPKTTKTMNTGGTLRRWLLSGKDLRAEVPFWGRWTNCQNYNKIIIDEQINLQDIFVHTKKKQVNKTCVHPVLREEEKHKTDKTK